METWASNNNPKLNRAKSKELIFRAPEKRAHCSAIPATIIIIIIISLLKTAVKPQQ